MQIKWLRLKVQQAISYQLTIGAKMQQQIIVRVQQLEMTINAVDNKCNLTCYAR